MLQASKCSHVSNELLFGLADCSSALRQLEVSHTRIDDLGLVAIARGCPEIQVSVSASKDPVTDRCVLVQKLNISSCSSVTHEGLTVLRSSCSKLTKLKAAWCNVGCTKEWSSGSDEDSS